MLPMIMRNYLSPRPTEKCPMFMDFSRGHGPLVYNAMSDVPLDLPPHYLFARKFSDESAERCEAAVGQLIAA